VLSIADQLAAELEPESEKTRPAPGSNVTSPRQKSGSTFQAANSVDTVEVLRHLDIEVEQTPRGFMARCPGCGELGALVCRGGLKCLHNRCADAGRPGHHGLRTNVDLVMTQGDCSASEAARKIGAWFGIPYAGDTPKHKDEADSSTTGAAPARPTTHAPLSGLPHLAKVALLGRPAILKAAAEQVAFVWQDIATAGGVVLLAGAPGEGKTTLLFLVLLARAAHERAHELLGRTIRGAAKGKYIVLVEGEHSEGSTARKLLASAKMLGIDDSATDHFIVVARRAIAIGSPAWQDIVALVSAGLVSDIAVDTIARIAAADADNEQQQVAIFEAVSQAIESAPAASEKPTVWVVAHTRKNNLTGGLADVSGSTQRTGQADTVLLVKGQRQNGRVASTSVTFAKLRETPNHHPAPATLTITDGQIVDGLAPDIRIPLEDRILELLNAEPKNKNMLARALDRSGKDIEAALTKLFREKKIVSEIRSVRGKSCKFFLPRVAS
jgi:AAA domain